MSKSQAKETITALVIKFQNNLADYHRASYNETLTRIDFINPFFEALGWDMTNRRGLPENLREVIHEDKLDIKGRKKAPDYSFRLPNGRVERKFFLEAKKPAVNLAADLSPAYQVRLYGWNAGLPLSALTDFEELAVYDCRVRPYPQDKTTVARIAYFTCLEYADRFDEIYDLFSKEAVQAGSLDQFIVEAGLKRGLTPVDAEFLKEIEGWRDSLAKTIALRNPAFSVYDLNFAVQRTIDRIIFLRMAEDRKIEPYEQLLHLADRPGIYPRLVALYRQADAKYNAGLFNFNPGGGGDSLTPAMQLDDAPLKQIITGLYPPKSPYEFSVMGVDILGNVYEQFLGKVIRLTAGHRAKVEEKPEVKKAGGVFYTPTYIVEAIVKQTIGPLLGLGVRVESLGSESQPPNPQLQTLNPISNEEELTNGIENVSRLGRVAESDGLGGGYLSTDEGIPGGGEVWSDEPTSSSGGLDSGQHRRGLRSHPSGGSSTSSFDSQRLADGSRDPSPDRRPTEVHLPRKGDRVVASVSTSRQDVDQTNQLPSTLNPKPQTLTPKEISQLRILDPACGSGSFLIGAYQFLLDYHLNWYQANGPEKHKKAVVWIPRANPSPAAGEEPGVGGEWRLTIAEKKRILLNNIFGVDIDRQAVNVTQLNLLLKALEGETDQTLQMSLFQERVLPELSRNIKCGNSLIDDQFFASGQTAMFPDEALLRRVNAFDWAAEFPEAMKAGGFDAIIGNPPYIRSINLKESNPEEWDYYRSKYKTASFREWDIYLIFVEKGLNLLKAGGRLGYILPNKFLNSQVGESLREILSAGKFLQKLIHFEAFQIFPTATTYTCLLFLDKSGQETAEIARYRGPVDKAKQKCSLPEEAPELWSISTIKTQELSASPWEFTSDLIAKFKKWPGLGSIADIFKGTGTNADKVYLLENRGREGDLVKVYSPELEDVFLLEPIFLKPALRGRSISRYEISGDLLLIVPYDLTETGGKLVPEKTFKVKAPKTLDYLKKCKPRLDQREDGRFKGEGWYQYGRPQNLHRFEVPEKILLPDVANRGTCSLDTKGMWLLDTAYAIVKKPGVEIDLRYILGILNSPILTSFLKETGTALRGGYFRMKTAYLTPFPIRTIDFANPAEVKQHDELVRLVEQMLALHQKMASAGNPADKQMYQRQIAMTDRAIDRLVYGLYNLSEAEIEIVEGRR